MYSPPFLTITLFPHKFPQINQIHSFHISNLSFTLLFCFVFFTFCIKHLPMFGITKSLPEKMISRQQS
ncbi:hypothetical protein E1A91_D04G124300v1, partial [Gossypium mustelinum]